MLIRGVATEPFERMADGAVPHRADWVRRYPKGLPTRASRKSR